jgi:hypothetical protein
LEMTGTSSGGGPCFQSSWDKESAEK